MKKFNTFAEVRQEYDAVQKELIQRKLRYNDETDTYYAKKRRRRRARFVQKVQSLEPCVKCRLQTQ